MLQRSALAVMVAFQSAAAFAGEPVTSSKEVVPPPPPPAPTSYFRANEWSLGAFATYNATWDKNRRVTGSHAWGGGVSVSYFPWLYAGFRLREAW